MIELTINGQQQRLDAEGDTPLLWVLRDDLGMTGTKYGCGVAQCGACSVLVDGTVMRSCVTPLEAVAGRQITTIEAVEKDPVGLGQASGRPMRLLPVGPSDGRHLAAETKRPSQG